MQKREDLEGIALSQFENVAHRHGFPVFKGQGTKNRIHISGNTYYQFGDLRVETSTHHVVLEVESAGGVTNLVKYWYCLEDAALSKYFPKGLILFHVFHQNSLNDYGSHLALWEFLVNQMYASTGERIQAFRYTYRTPSDLDVAIQHFEKYLVSFH